MAAELNFYINPEVGLYDFIYINTDWYQTIEGLKDLHYGSIHIRRRIVRPVAEEGFQIMGIGWGTFQCDVFSSHE